MITEPRHAVFSQIQLPQYAVFKIILALMSRNIFVLLKNIDVPPYPINNMPVKISIEIAVKNPMNAFLCLFL